MKSLGGLLVIVFALPIVFGAIVGAEPEIIVHSNHLDVVGEVLAAHHVVVDESGNITEILSNTTHDVTPTFYRGTVSKDSIIDPSPEVISQYHQLVPEGHSQVGILYQRTSPIYIFEHEPDPFQNLNESILTN